MTDAEPVAIVRAYLTALGGDDPSAVVALVAEDFRNEHNAELGSGSQGRAEYAQRLPGFFAAFLNRRYQILELTVGPLFGPSGGAHPTRTEVVVSYRFHADAENTRIDIPGIMWISIDHGRIIRRLDCWDSLTYHHQTNTTP